MKDEYANKFLANDYLTYGLHYNIDDVKKIAKAIANAKENIAEFCRENNGLKDLHEKGVGINTKKVLESIIKYEIEGAIRKHDEESIGRYRERIKFSQVNKSPSEPRVDSQTRWG